MTKTAGLAVAVGVSVLALTALEAAARDAFPRGRMPADFAQKAAPGLRLDRVARKATSDGSTPVSKPGAKMRLPDLRAKLPDRPPTGSGKPPRGDGGSSGNRPDQADSTKPPRPSKPPRGDGAPPHRPDRPGGKPPPIVVIVPPLIDVPRPPDRRDPPVVNKPPRGTKPPKETADATPPRRLGGPLPPVIIPLAPPTLADTGGQRRPPAAPLLPTLPPRGPVPAASPPVAAALGGEALANELVFAVVDSTPAGVEDQIAQAANIQIVERTNAPGIGLRLMRCHWRRADRLQPLLTQLRADPRVIDVQANYLYRPSQGASVSSGLQYALAKLDVDSGALTSGGRGVRIAIIDSGVDRAHPDLSGVAVERFDALGGTAADVGTHGTAIAGIISARGTLRGVAPDATLLSVRAFASERSSVAQVTTTFVLLKSLEWAIANGARVVNMSLAGPRDPLLEKAVTTAAGKGVLLVAAAGNNGDKAPPAYPAAYEQVLAVTAIDAGDKLYSRANRGAYIALSAPGVDVLAPATGRAHAMQTGTSFAAAHVTGVLALMLERDPNLSIDSARRMLVETAVDLGDPGRDDAFGAGRISAAAALRALGK